MHEEDLSLREESISFTKNAAERVCQCIHEEHFFKETAGLRVSVLPGGCAEFKYNFKIEEAPLSDDFIMESEGARLFVDGFSLQYLQGSIVDYHISLEQSGFEIVNPNATGGCGCGESFSVS